MDVLNNVIDTASEVESTEYQMPGYSDDCAVQDNKYLDYKAMLGHADVDLNQVGKNICLNQLFKAMAQEDALYAINDIESIVRVCTEQFGLDVANWTFLNDAERAELSDALMPFVQKFDVKLPRKFAYNDAEISAKFDTLQISLSTQDNIVKLFNGGEFPEGYIGNIALLENYFDSQAQNSFSSDL